MTVENDDYTTFLQAVRYRGDGPVSIPLVDPDDGSAFDPTGHTLIFTLKASETAEDVDALVQKISAVGGITVANPSVVTLVPEDYAELTAEVTYEFDIQAQAAATGLVKTVARGTLRFAYDITRELTLSIPTTTTNPDAGFTWAGLPDKPATFPPSAHTHPLSEITGLDELTASTTAANADGDTTLTLPERARHLAAAVTLSGSAGTRRIVLADTNATAGCLVSLRLVFPATAGIVVELRSGADDGALLATVTSDGTAGTVGIICARGAAAWDDPVQAAWLD